MQFPSSNRNNHSLKQWLSLGLLGLMALPSAAAWSDDGFGGDWQPRPLVDTTQPPASTLSAAKATSGKAAASPTAAPQPDLEARLKPVEPFIREVENRLNLKPKPSVSLVQRLNTVQTVLFGAPTYQDAGALITKLAEIFPQEAQKAQAAMSPELQQTQKGMQATAQPASSSQKGHPKLTPAPPGSLSTSNPMVLSHSAPSASPSSSGPKKKRGFWSGGDDLDSDFDNDPFFQDGYQGRVKTSTSGSTTSSTTSGMASNAPFSNSNGGFGQSRAATSQQGPSRMASIAQSLAGLALTAGALAGTYYLNNKSGGNRGYGNNAGAYPNNPYGYAPYGNPYGTGPYGANGMPSYGNGVVVNPYNVSPYSVSPYAISPFAIPRYSGYNGTSAYTGNTQTYQVMPYGVGIVPYQR